MENKLIQRGFIRKKLYALLHENGLVVKGELHKKIKAIFVEYGEVVTTEAQVQMSKNQLPKQRGFKFTGTVKPKEVDVAHKTPFAKPVMKHNPPLMPPPSIPKKQIETPEQLAKEPVSETPARPPVGFNPPPIGDDEETNIE